MLNRCRTGQLWISCSTAKRWDTLLVPRFAVFMIRRSKQSNGCGSCAARRQLLSSTAAFSVFTLHTWSLEEWGAEELSCQRNLKYNPEIKASFSLSLPSSVSVSLSSVTQSLIAVFLSLGLKLTCNYKESPPFLRICQDPPLSMTETETTPPMQPSM